MCYPIRTQQFGRWKPGSFVVFVYFLVAQKREIFFIVSLNSCKSQITVVGVWTEESTPKVSCDLSKSVTKEPVCSKVDPSRNRHKSKNLDKKVFLSPQFKKELKIFFKSCKKYCLIPESYFFNDRWVGYSRSELIGLWINPIESFRLGFFWYTQYFCTLSVWKFRQIKKAQKFFQNDEVEFSIWVDSKYFIDSVIPSTNHQMACVFLAQGTYLFLLKVEYVPKWHRKHACSRLLFMMSVESVMDKTAQ